MAQFNLDYRPDKPERLVGYKKGEAAQIVKHIADATCVLITGASGTGKTTLALAAAKAITNPENIHQANAAAQTGIDDVRDLIKKAGPRSLSGKKRVFIVDEVHALSKQAMSALLIPLENPKPNTIWILCTNEPERLPVVLTRRAIKFQTPDWTEKRLKRLAVRVSKASGKPVPKNLKQFANPSDMLTFMQTGNTGSKGAESQKRNVATATYLLNILLGNGHDRRKVNYDFKYSTIMEISLAVRGTLGAVLPYESPDPQMMQMLRAADPKIVARLANGCATALRDDTRPPMVLLDILVGAVAAPYLFEKD